MKKLSICVMVAFAACVMMLTSCLDGNNSSSAQIGGAGVVKFSSSSMRSLLYFNNRDLPLYHSSLNSMTENTCVVFYATIDSDNEANENIATTGYYVPSSFDYVEIGSSSLSSYMTDTTKVTENELAVKDLTEYGFIQDYLFFLINLSENKPEQKNYYSLEYDKIEPEEINGKRIYNLYLRVRKTEDGVNGTESNVAYGFNSSYFINSAHQQEKLAGENTINLRINYISEIDDTDEDDIQIKKWSYLDMGSIYFSDEN
ncbi:MAG: hypothetical protein LIP05_06580 [Tannerellaceae bacterium]|nr:hypothetical protein [Tannerellaceae bacterium]